MARNARARLARDERGSQSVRMAGIGAYTGVCRSQGRHNSCRVYARPPRRKIFLWKGMRQDVKEFANTYQYPDPSTPNALEQMWSDIKQMLSETVEKRVPSKTSAARHTNP
ncbi:hypothetical protein ACOMHN_002641 [Nucella lapillus]